MYLIVYSDTALIKRLYKMNSTKMYSEMLSEERKLFLIADGIWCHILLTDSNQYQDPDFKD